MIDRAPISRQAMSFEDFARSLPSSLQSSPPVVLHGFARLPVEMQLRVAKHCDAPTLWQLMRTSSSLRSEAQSLFWSHSDLWFAVGGRGWWRAKIASRKHLLDYQSDFLRHVKQIHFDPEFRQDIFADSDHAETFWRDVQESFPAVTRVVFEDYTSGHQPVAEVQDDWPCLKLWRQLVDAAPKHVEAKLLVHDMYRRYGMVHENFQCLVLSNAESGAEMQQLLHCFPKQLVMPPASWAIPESPMLQFEAAAALGGKLRLAERDLKVATLETYADSINQSGESRCPGEACAFATRNREAWYEHVLGWHDETYAVGNVDGLTNAKPLDLSTLCIAPTASRHTIESIKHKRQIIFNLKGRHEAQVLRAKNLLRPFSMSEDDINPAYAQKLAADVDEYLCPSSCVTRGSFCFEYAYSVFNLFCEDLKIWDGYKLTNGYDEVPDKWFDVNYDDTCTLGLDQDDLEAEFNEDTSIDDVDLGETEEE